MNAGINEKRITGLGSGQEEMRHLMLNLRCLMVQHDAVQKEAGNTNMNLDMEERWETGGICRISRSYENGIVQSWKECCPGRHGVQDRTQ